MGADNTLFVVDADETCWPAMRHMGQSLGLKVAAYDSGQRFLNEYCADRVGCLVSEFRIWDMSGLRILEQLRELKSPLPMIFVSSHATVPLAVRALRAGALDVFEKPADDTVLAESVLHAIQLSRINLDSASRRREIQQRLQTLTPQEHDVLDGLQASNGVREIADRLHVSQRTVQSCRRRVLGKLGIASSHELTHMWRDLILLDGRASRLNSLLGPEPPIPNVGVSFASDSPAHDLQVVGSR